MTLQAYETFTLDLPVSAPARSLDLGVIEDGENRRKAG